MSTALPVRKTCDALRAWQRVWRLRHPWVLFVGAVFALAPRAASGASKDVVLVVADLGGSAQPSEADLLGAVRGQLRELGVGVLLVRAAREPLAIAARRAKQIAAREEALAVIWLETSSEHLELFLYDASGHLYSRSIESSGSTASQSEAVAIVLRFAIGALLEGGSIGMKEVQLQPAPPAEPAPPPISPPAGSSRVREASQDATELRAGVSYVGETFMRGGPWQQGAALLLSAQPARSALFVGASYTYLSTLALTENGVRVELRRRPAEMFVGWELGTSTLRVDVRGALGADYVRRRTTAVAEDWSATPNASRWLWAVSARFGVTLAVSRRLHAFSTLGADYVLTPYSLVAAPVAGSNEALGAALRVRPRAEVGLTISAW